MKLSNSLKNIIFPPDNQVRKSIRIMSLVLAAIYLIRLISGWDQLLQDFLYSRFDLLDRVEFAVLILYPIALAGLWKMKKYGWILSTMLLSYQTFGAIVFIGHHILFYEEHSYSFEFLPERNWDDVLSANLYALVLFGSVLYFINQRRITKAFEIERLTQLLSFLSVVIPLIILTWHQLS